MDWMKTLILEIENEFGQQPPSCVLATVNRGAPRVRMMICRNIQEDGTLVFATDSRSEKIEELRDCNSAEILFWFPKTQKQFRVRGSISTEDQSTPFVLQMWKKMPAWNRARYYWPDPGRQREHDDKYLLESPTESGPPNTFLLFKVRPNVCEFLDVSSPKHRRQRWSSHEDWKKVELSP